MGEAGQGKEVERWEEQKKEMQRIRDQGCISIASNGGVDV